MSTVAVTHGAVAVRRHRFSGAARDSFAITRRNLITYRRVPALLVFTLIEPVIFVLLFRYVFGGAIGVPGGVSYVDFLIPGIFVQTAVFGATNTAIGLATDVKSGLLERFRALPMARSAVLTGRTFADLGAQRVRGRADGRGGLCRRLPRAHRCRAVHTGDPARAAVRLRVLLGLRHRRSRDRRPRERPGGHLPPARPAGVRLVGVRAGGDDARLAAGLRRAPAGVGDCVGRARPHARRARHVSGAAVSGMVRRDRRRSARRWP